MATIPPSHPYRDDVAAEVGYFATIAVTTFFEESGGRETARKLVLIDGEDGQTFVALKRDQAIEFATKLLLASREVQ